MADPETSGPQAIMFAARYLDAVRSGVKTRTTRFNDPAVLGPARLVFPRDPEVVLDAEVTHIKHCTLGEVTDDDARAEGLETAADLQRGLKAHYPDIDLADEVDVITFRLEP